MDRTSEIGLTAKRGRCQISFAYQGERFRVVLSGLLYSRPSDRTQALRIRSAALREITLGTFYFPKHFPHHPAARRFLKGHQLLIGDSLKQWLLAKRELIERTTYRGYEKTVLCYLTPTFGRFRLSELQTSDVEQWLAGLAVTGKTKNNILIPLRALYRQALRDEKITRDPIERIPHQPHRTKEPYPLSRTEIEAILAACEGQVQNIIEFAIWTGLRTSELIAVRWQDVAINKKKLHIRMTRTSEGEKAYGKTEASVRTMDLHPQALAALERQLPFTKGKLCVFENPRTGEPWKHDGPYRKIAWIPTLKKAGVSHRPAYQTRHTYASLLLSAGVNHIYVAAQMGHRDWGMIRKVYGRWIPEFTKNETDKIASIWTPERHLRNARR